MTRAIQGIGLGLRKVFLGELLETERTHPSHPRAIVIAPTRELAAQIADSFRAYGQFMRPALQVGVIVGGAFPYAARRAARYGDGWIPLAGRPTQYGDAFDYVPKFREMLKENGRDPATFPVSLFYGIEDIDTLKRYRDLGIVRCVASLPSGNAASAASWKRAASAVATVTRSCTTSSSAASAGMASSPSRSRRPAA